MRPIKFDLPLNGTRIATLEQLGENLTPEIFELFRSGKLAKWLRVRSLDEQAEAVEALLAGDNEREVQLLKGLYEVFGGETDHDLLQTEIAERKRSLPLSQGNCDMELEAVKTAFEKEIEQLKTEFSKKEHDYQQEIEILKNPPKSEISIGKFITRDDGTALDTKTGLTWCRYLVGQQWLNGGAFGAAERMNWDEAMKAATSFNTKIFAGFINWRLPSIEELENVTTEKGCKPSINKTVFSNKVENCFWSSTHDFSDKAWILNSSYGSNLNIKKNSHAVWLVRS
jgi:hypothetical protein